MKCLAVTLFVLLTTLAAHGEIPRKIKVREVQGKVLAWEPWDSLWIPVESGLKLWESTLVQVTPGASVTFTLDAREGFSGLQADTVDITLNRPTVLRIDGNVLRKVQLSTFFIPQMPDVTKAENASSKDPLFRSLNEAWDRFAAVVMPGAIRASFLQAALDEEKDDASVGARSKKIHLVTPRDGMLAMAEKLPLELTVLWKPIEDKNALYEVMIWKIDEPRRPPLGITRYDYHYARLYSEGTYYVQVGTQDGRWQSKVHQVHVSLPLEGRPNRGLAGGANARPLPLLAPPEHFNYIAEKIPASLTFAWERGDSRAPQNYTLTLMDGAGRELMKRTTAERTLRVKMNRPGDYRWQIEATPQSASRAGRKVFSEVREFKLQNWSEVAKPGKDILTEVILGQANGVYYLEKGF